MLRVEAANQEVQRDRETVVASVTQAVGDGEEFVKELQGFLEAYPNDPTAREIQSYGEDHDLIQSTTAWIRVLTDDVYREPEKTNAATAAAWIDLAQAAQALSVNRHPFSHEPMKWLEHYQAIARREQLIQELKAAVGSPLLQSMFVYQDKQGQQYYSRQPPDKNSQTAHVVPVYQDLGLHTEEKNFGIRFKAEVLPKVRPAGHNQFGETASELMKQISETEFTPTLFRLIVDLKDDQSEPEFDPVHRLAWMRRLIRLGAAGSYPIRIAYEDWLTETEAASVQWDVNWIAPTGDPEIELVRQQAQQRLEDFDDWAARVETMSHHFRAFRAQRVQPPKWIGWVSRNKMNHIAQLKDDPGSDPIFVLVPTSSGNIDLIQITASGLQTVITDAAAQKSGLLICTIPHHDTN